MWQQKLRRPLLISSGIMGIIAILALSLVGLFNYTPDTSVPFPYIPPLDMPPEGYYIEATIQHISDQFYLSYHDVELESARYIGKSFIFNNILIDDLILKARTETYIFISHVQFVPQYPSELENLKEGDVVDIVGVCMGVSEATAYVWVTDCRFLPAGLVQLLVPGGTTPMPGGY